jgi:hypothetical protein
VFWTGIKALTTRLKSELKFAEGVKKIKFFTGAAAMSR